ncbi:hypothetical protein SSTU70S_04896 [Stutzerimonas stutzeri]
MVSDAAQMIAFARQNSVNARQSTISWRVWVANTSVSSSRAASTRYSVLLRAAPEIGEAPLDQYWMQ